MSALLPAIGKRCLGGRVGRVVAEKVDEKLGGVVGSMKRKFLYYKLLGNYLLLQCRNDYKNVTHTHTHEVEGKTDLGSVSRTRVNFILLWRAS